MGGCGALRPPCLTACCRAAVEQESGGEVAKAMAHFARARLAQGLDNDLEMAAVSYESAARLMPGELRFVVLAATSWVALGRNERANALVASVAGKYAGSASAQSELARVLWDAGYREEARGYFDRALRLEPADPQPLLGLAFLLLRAGDTGEAREVFNLTLKHAPEAPMAYVGLAMSALETGDIEGALAIVDEAIERGVSGPSMTLFLREIAILMIAQGRYHEALPPLNALRAEDPDALDVHQMTALVYARSDRHDDAREAMQRWPQASEEPATVADRMAQIYETGDDPARAIPYALQAVELPDPPLGAWLRAGRLLLMDGRAEAAASVMADATAQYPDEALAWMFLGLAYSALEAHESALQALETTAGIAERADPETLRLPTRFDFWLAAAYERVERYADAERHFKRSIEEYPEIHEAFNYLAYMWAERAVNLDEAKALVKVALEADPESGAYIDTLGWIYYQKGRYEQALETLRRALEKSPDHPVIIEHVGDALHALERTGEAIEYWKRSFLKDPTNEDVYDKLKREGVDVDGLKAEDHRP